MPSAMRNTGAGAAGFSTFGGSTGFVSAGDFVTSTGAGGSEDAGGIGACSAGGAEPAQPNVTANSPKLRIDRYCNMPLQ